MVLYRIAKCNFINDLTGTGARLYGGRWNSVGQSMVYLASTRALAVLEVLVHLSPTILPRDFCIAEIEVPEDSIVAMPVKQLPYDWQDISPSLELKRLGDNFIKQQRNLVLKVPSAIVPDEFNYLINPNHIDASKIKLLKKESFNFDARLTTS